MYPRTPGPASMQAESGSADTAPWQTRNSSNRPASMCDRDSKKTMNYPVRPCLGRGRCRRRYKIRTEPTNKRARAKTTSRRAEKPVKANSEVMAAGNMELEAGGLALVAAQSGVQAGSATPGGGVTVAVLAMVPAVAAGAVPLRV